VSQRLIASLEWTAAQQEYRMLIATTENLPGHSVKEVKGQVFGVVVRSRGIAGNILAGLLALVVERWLSSAARVSGRALGRHRRVLRGCRGGQDHAGLVPGAHRGAALCRGRTGWRQSFRPSGVLIGDGGHAAASAQ
jgi:hypothetical protein